jgi:hypothetical protein
VHIQKIVFPLSNRDANCENAADCRMQLPLTTRLVKINGQEQREKRKQETYTKMDRRYTKLAASR